MHARRASHLHHLVRCRSASRVITQRLPQHTLVLWPSTRPPSVQPPSTHAFAAPDRYTVRHPQLDTPVATRSSAHHAARPATKARPAAKAWHVTQLDPSPKHSTPFSSACHPKLGPPPELSMPAIQRSWPTALGPPSNLGSPSARSHSFATRAPPPPTLGSMWMLFVKALWLLPRSPKVVCRHTISVAIVVGHSHYGARSACMSTAQCMTANTGLSQSRTLAGAGA